jgi:hypothetical protein
MALREVGFRGCYERSVKEAEVGAGELKAKVTAHIPDYDYEDTRRTEVAMYTTNIVIVKTL